MTPTTRALDHIVFLVGDLEHTPIEVVDGFVQTIVSLEGGERFRVEVEFIDEDAR